MQKLVSIKTTAGIAALLTTAIICQANPVQQRLTGTVTDVSGEPLPATSIRLQSTRTGIGVGELGQFSLPLPSRPDTLIFRHVGYKAQKVPISAATRSPLNVQLVVDENTLQEVEVSTGYYTIPQERATGSFTHIDNALLNRSVSTDILERLEGVTHSLLFDRRNLTEENVDGAPELRIRGLSTIEGNSAPLIVVDNFPFEGDLSAINPNDVEDITVLRDAAAASIWGARAGNGVIVINTKRGRYGQPTRISFNSSFNFTTKPDLFYSQSRLPAPTVMEIQRERFEMGGYQENDQIFIPSYVELLIKQRDGLITADEFEAAQTYMRNTDLRRQSLDYLYQTALNQQYALGIRGGGERYTYAISGGYDRNDGSNIGNLTDRASISLQNSFKIGSRLEVNGTFAYTRRNETRNGLGYVRTASIYEGLVDENGNPKSIVSDYRMSYHEAAEANGMLDWVSRPLDEIHLRDHRNNSRDMRFGASANFKVIKGLTLAGAYQYLLGEGTSVSLYDKESYFVRNLVNRFTQEDGSQVIPYNAILDHGTTSGTETHSGRLQANFNRQLGRAGDLALLAGADIAQGIQQTGPGARIYDYDKDLWTGNSVLDYTTRYTVRPSGRARIPYNTYAPTRSINRTLSYFGNGSYSYLQRYTLTGSARWDGSNLFGVKTNQRGVALWSIGGSWEVSKEPFYRMKRLPYLRIRSTYGSAGNIDKSQSYYPTISVGTDGRTGLNNAVLSSPGNPSLRWEQVKTWNLGVDWALVNRRISGSIEYYRKHASDLLGNNLMDPTTGISLNSAYKMNYGSMRTTGWDVMLNSRNLTGPFSWNSALLVSGSQNEITHFNGPVQQSALNYMNRRLPEKGKSVDVLYALPWHGLDPTDGMPIVYVDGEQTTDYDSYILNYPIENLIDVGSLVPKVFGSLRNTFSWKGVEMSALISFKAGHVFRRPSLAPGQEYSDIYHMDYFKRWQKPGDEMHTQVPAKSATADLGGSAYLYSETLITKGDVIRLQDVNIGYSFSGDWLKRARIQQIKVFGYARNLGILWRANDNGLDPDYPNADYPAPRRFALGIQTMF